MARKYIRSQESIKRLQQSPYISRVNESQIGFTDEFLTMVTNELLERTRNYSSRTILNKFNINHNDLGYLCTHNLFIRLKERASILRGDTYSDDQLVEIGLCFRQRSSTIHIIPEIFNTISENYPQLSVDESLSKLGFDVGKIPSQFLGRLRFNIKKNYENNVEIKVKKYTNSSSVSKEDIPTHVVSALETHPYIETVNTGQLLLNQLFYYEAFYLKRLTIDEILTVFCLNHSELPTYYKYRIKLKLDSLSVAPTTTIQVEANELTLRISKNVVEAMKIITRGICDEVQNTLKEGSLEEKKEIVLKIQEASKKYPLVHLLSLFNLPKTTYYNILKKPLKNKDADDLKSIKEIIFSDEYPKGTRMVTMALNDDNDERYNRKRVQRIMRENNLLCEVRKTCSKNPLIENIQPNRLKRKFRLARPFTHLTTDITYLIYNQQRAYLSAIKDASSGVILAYSVADNQTINLAYDTINQLEQYTLNDNAMIHSDQGSVYCSYELQQRIADLGLNQSMSKRGNSQDNASIESYFGHFKDEVNIVDITDIDKLKEAIDKYMHYYNYRRHQWDRKRMTPKQFEYYLMRLSEEEFMHYLGKEQAIYDKKKEKAKELAIKRTKTLGV